MFPKGKERQPDRDKVRTKNVAFKVTEKEYKTLKALAKKQKTSYSLIIRERIKDLIQD